MTAALLKLAVAYAGFLLVLLVVVWACERWKHRTERLLERIWSLPTRVPDHERRKRAA